METKKCKECGDDFFSMGMGNSCRKCVDNYHRERERKNPYVVHYGNDYEEFETEKEAEVFLSELRNAYIEKR